MSTDPSRIERLPSLAEQFVRDKRFAGVAWRVTQSGQILNGGVAGYTGSDQNKPLQKDAIYRIYSMTKPIVSIAALQLVEAGKLRLYDPVASYIPAFADVQVQTADGQLQPLHRPMLVEDLLTHRAGLSYDFLPDCAIAGHYRQAMLAGDATRSLAEFNAVLAGMPLAWQPGSRWHYSYATDVLAHVLEHAAGQALPELLSEQIFNPLGMCDTAFSVADNERHRLLPMYGMRDLDEPMPADPPAHVLQPMDVESGYPSTPAANFVRGGHGLFSTVDDYCRFMPVLLDGKAADGQALLSAPMVNMMWQNRIPQKQRPLQIGPNVLPGYGWNLFGRVMLDTGESMKLTAAGEGGWAGAASTHFWVDRELQMTGVVMAQFLGSGVGLGDEMQTAAYQCFMTP